MVDNKLFEQIFSLDGKVALVTGGSKGLGEIMADTLSKAGAKVAICSRNKQEADDAARKISEASGNPVIAIKADISSYSEIKDMIKNIEEHLGSIDILVNSAGINIRKGTEELTEEDWDSIININLKGAFLLAKELLPKMKAKKWGRIMFLGSNQSYVAIPGRAAYGSSKAGILGLTRTLALESAADGVCVNALCPGPFDTPMNFPVTKDPAKFAEFIKKLPIGRWGNVDEIRGITLYLCSNACSFMTGSGITLDGGWTAQ